MTDCASAGLVWSGPPALGVRTGWKVGSEPVIAIRQANIDQSIATFGPAANWQSMARFAAIGRMQVAALSSRRRGFQERRGQTTR
jgi:hypothetical protein